MPQCFQFFMSEVPVSLVELDQLVCEYLNVPCHPSRYNDDLQCVFFRVGMGESLRQIEDDPDQYPEIKSLAKWLREQGYTTNAWAERGKM